MLTPLQPFKLFDLSADIHEDTDLAKLYPQVVQSLTEIANRAHTDDPNWPKVNCVSSILD